VEYEFDMRHGATPYERLAAAIVRQAALDYLDAWQRWHEYREGSIGWERGRSECYVMERWFSSDWCDALTMGHGEAVLDMVKRGYLF